MSLFERIVQMIFLIDSRIHLLIPEHIYRGVFVGFKNIPLSSAQINKPHYFAPWKETIRKKLSKYVLIVLSSLALLIFQSISPSKRENSKLTDRDRREKVSLSSRLVVKWRRALHPHRPEQADRGW